MTFSVIPAKAGIQSRGHICSLCGIDFRFRVNDDLIGDNNEKFKNVNTTLSLSILRCLASPGLPSLQSTERATLLYDNETDATKCNTMQQIS